MLGSWGEGDFALHRAVNCFTPHVVANSLAVLQAKREPINLLLRDLLLDEMVREVATAHSEKPRQLLREDKRLPATARWLCGPTAVARRENYQRGKTDQRSANTSKHHTEDLQCVSSALNNSEQK